VYIYVLRIYHHNHRIHSLRAPRPTCLQTQTCICTFDPTSSGFYSDDSDHLGFGATNRLVLTESLPQVPVTTNVIPRLDAFVAGIGSLFVNIDPLSGTRLIASYLALRLKPRTRLVSLGLAFGGRLSLPAITSSRVFYLMRLMGF